MRDETVEKPTMDEAAEKNPDAGRVAPISACVSYQIQRTIIRSVRNSAPPSPM